ELWKALAAPLRVVPCRPGPAIASPAASRPARAYRRGTRPAQTVEFLLELDLQPAFHRLVVYPFTHRIGEAGLVQRHAALAVVVVLVALGVAEFLHQPGRRIAQVHRHLLGAVLGDIAARGLVGDVGGV